MRIFFLRKMEEVLNSILLEIKPKNILLVTGRRSYQTSRAKNYFNALPPSYEVIHFNDFSPNPKYGEIKECLKYLADKHFDLIISIGGGSVIDFAKLIKAFYLNPYLVEGDLSTEFTIYDRVPFICIPTTAGSGSEATHFAVLYKDGKKYSVAEEALQPTYAIVDPSLTHSMPPYLTACTGLDALSQAIESLWARNGTTESREYARIACFYLIPHIEKAVLNPSLVNRRAMAIGAFFAGRAINISKTTAAHALAYYLTEVHDVPHGEAVGINLGRLIIVNFDRIEPSYRETIFNLTNADCAETFSKWFEFLKKKIGLRSSLEEINGLNISRYFEQINEERLINDPSGLSREGLKQILT